MKSEKKFLKVLTSTVKHMPVLRNRQMILALTYASQTTCSVFKVRLKACSENVLFCSSYNTLISSRLLASLKDSRKATSIML